VTPALLDPPSYGDVVSVLPGIRRLTCENPSVMTGPGTNTYLVGHGRLVAIDPGPADDAHADAVAAAADGRLVAIVVTHTHPDHSPGARRLAELTGAKTLGLGARDGYEPDEIINDATIVSDGDIMLRAVHTPGHAANHIAFLTEVPSAGAGRGGDDDQGGGAGRGGEVVLFSGDHIMSGSTVVIAPPDGDMAQYLDSLRKILDLEPPATIIAPGHGAIVSDPRAIIEYYISHRLQREAAVLASLRARGEAVVEEIVTDVYTDVPELLHPIARFSVWAHLRKLHDEGTAESATPDEVTATWRHL
jgi:glyoxylase-like metal-dependent hydrolase (beta-lactamase superfamily II)